MVYVLVPYQLVVTESLSLARQAAIVEKKNKSNEGPMLSNCGLCGKGYRSSKAHVQHLKSKRHILRASQGTHDQADGAAIIEPLPPRNPKNSPTKAGRGL
ncbi:hypothetical protein AgCh_029801 [Apium graveolens]